MARTFWCGGKGFLLSIIRAGELLTSFLYPLSSVVVFLSYFCFCKLFLSQSMIVTFCASNSPLQPTARGGGEGEGEQVSAS